jgi:transposase-like protein
MLLRMAILTHAEDAEILLSGEIELAESYFGGRPKGRRGRGALAKTIVFGIFKRNGRVYTEVVPDCKRATLQAVTPGRVDPGSVVNNDGWRGCNGLVDLGYKKHFRVDHDGNDEFAQGKTHINGIESFRAFAKTRLLKYKGMSRRTFYLHLKEREFRFNNRDQDLYKLLLKMFRKNPLF